MNTVDIKNQPKKTHKKNKTHSKKTTCKWAFLSFIVFFRIILIIAFSSVQEMRSTLNSIDF